MRDIENTNGIDCFSTESDLHADVDILSILKRIETKLDALAQEKTIQPYYSIEEFAKRVNRSKFCCREWARLGRINADKKMSGRGTSSEWRVSHEEYLRYMCEGLLPDPRRKSSD